MDTAKMSDDLIAEILIRLPMKDVYRCRCVCKPWKTLISEPNFINTFITRSKSAPPLLTAVFYWKSRYTIDTQTEEIDTDFLDFHTLTTASPFDASFSFPQRSVLPVAVHNGFLLFSNSPSPHNVHITMYTYRYNYFVCNPLTKQCVHLPKPRCIHSIKNTFLFCYNTKGSAADQHIEFKVVSIVPKSTHPHEIKLELYSSQTEKWKLSSIFDDQGTISDVVFMFNGCIYAWMISHLLVYDFMEETTRKVELPPNASPRAAECFGVSDGSLYYAHTHLSSFLVCVLVEGGGWDLVHKVDCASLLSAFPDVFGSYKQICWFTPFCFHPLNPELILAKSCGKMIMYHTGTREVKVIDGFHPRQYPPVIPYSLPAWLPHLPNTPPAAITGKRKQDSSSTNRKKKARNDKL